jgi:hypothetical protein
VIESGGDEPVPCIPEMAITGTMEPLHDRWGRGEINQGWDSSCTKLGAGENGPSNQSDRPNDVRT